MPQVPVIIRGKWEAESNVTSVNCLNVVVNFADPVWNGVGSHRIFSIDGTVRLRMWIICLDKLTDAADLATIKFGHKNGLSKFIADTDAAGKNGNEISVGQLWFAPGAAVRVKETSAVILDYVVSNGLDVGYTISGEALTGGSLEFYCVWEPLSLVSGVDVGDGGPL